MKPFKRGKNFDGLLVVAQSLGIDPRLLSGSEADFEEFIKLVNLRGPNRKVVRNYPKIFPYSVKGYTVEKTVKEWPKRNERIEVENGFLPDHIRDLLPFRTSKFTKYVGDINIAFGASPFKIIRPDNKVMEYIRSRVYSNSANEFEMFLFRQNERVIIKPSWPAIEGEFEGFSSPPSDEYSPRLDLLIDTVKRNIHKVFLPIVGKYNPDSILDLETNPESFTGFVGSKIWGHTHRQADKRGKPVARELAKQIMNRSMYDKSLYVASPVRPRFRDFAENVEAKGRLGMMPEYHTKMIASSVMTPIMKGVVEYNKLFSDSEVKLGLDFMHNNLNTFSEGLKNAFGYIEADFSRFDQNITEEYLLVALGILRSCFDSSERIDNIFLFIASGFIFKNVLIPGRFVYRLSKGLPSGHPCTSLVGTLVSWLAWSLTLDQAGIKERKLYCYGDDFLASIFKEVAYNKVIGLKEWILKNSNLKLDPLRFIVNDKYLEQDLSDRPSLLKTVDNEGLPARKWSDWVDSLVYGRKNTSYIDLSYRITGLMYSPSFDVLVMETLIYLRTWLRVKALKYYNQKPGSCGRAWDSISGAKSSLSIAQRTFLMDKVTKDDVSKMGLWWMDGYENIVANEDIDDPEVLKLVERYYVSVPEKGGAPPKRKIKKFVKFENLVEEPIDEQLEFIT